MGGGLGEEVRRRGSGVGDVILVCGYFGYICAR